MALNFSFSSFPSHGLTVSCDSVIAGFKLAQKKLGSRARRVIGIDASATVPQTFDRVLRIARATAARIGLSEDDITDKDVILDDRYHAGIYGVPDDQTLDAIRFGAQTEAFITDPGEFTSYPPPPFLNLNRQFKTK